MGKMGKTEKKKSVKQDYFPQELPDDPNTEMANEQLVESKQIVETGTVTPTKGKYTIHCLTIIGQIVIIDNADV
jgi:hypothetical protein